MKRYVTYAMWGLALSACSGGQDDGTVAEPPLVETIADAPAAASFSIEGTIDVDGPIVALGASADGRPVLATERRIYEIYAGELEWHPLYIEDDETIELGEVRAIAPRLDGGAWIGGGERLFVVDTLYVLPSPLALDAGPIHAISEVASGALAGLWIGTETGLFRRTDTSLESWTIPGASGAVTAVAIERNGRFGAAVVGGRLVTLETNGGEVLTDHGVVDLGLVRALASATGAVWGAGEKGVVRFSLDEDPPYRMYTFGGSSDAHAVATDPVTGVAWARTADALVEIDGTTLFSYPLPMAPDRTPSLAIDMLGDVFSATEAGLSRNGTGAAGAGVSFETNVRPWIQEHCSECHMNATQNFEDYEVFLGLAEDALSRVRTGDMPRCAGGVRCADAMHLTPEQYAVLEQWLRDGKME